MCVWTSHDKSSSKFSTGRASRLFTTVPRSICVSRDPVTLSSSATASALCPIGSVWLLPGMKEKIKGRRGKERKATTEANTPLAWRGKGRRQMVQERNGSIPNLPGMEGKVRGKSKKSPQLRSEGAYEGSWWDRRKSRTQPHRFASAWACGCASAGSPWVHEGYFKLIWTAMDSKLILSRCHKLRAILSAFSNTLIPIIKLTNHKKVQTLA